MAFPVRNMILALTLVAASAVPVNAQDSMTKKPDAMKSDSMAKGGDAMKADKMGKDAMGKDSKGSDAMKKDKMGSDSMGKAGDAMSPKKM